MTTSNNGEGYKQGLKDGEKTTYCKVENSFNILLDKLTYKNKLLKEAYDYLVKDERKKVSQSRQDLLKKIEKELETINQKEILYEKQNIKS